MSHNRRVFLSASAAAAVVGANDRIRIAGIGTGGRCRYLLSVAVKEPHTELVAVADVYEPRRAEIRKFAPAAQEYVDYRRLLERKDIDAVFVGSPDHWHVPMAVDAVRAGKDVYVEKPLTKTIAEGPLIEKAVAETGRVLQAGYQQRSWPHFMAAREHMPKLGKVTLVMSSWYQNYRRLTPAQAKVDAAKLDWKRWLGNAPAQPLDPFKYYRWRWFWDFGGGHLTDLHSHYGDVIHWYMNAYQPESAKSMGGRYMLEHLECPDTITTAWRYRGFQVVYNGTLVCTMEGGNIIFRGTDAMMRINRDGFAIYPEGKVPPEKTHLPEPVVAMRSEHDGTIDHVRNFLECVRSRRTPNAPVAEAVAAAAAAHMGNAALKA
ncbi:MAG: Gfo/Idh/MocA family protein [Bryobacteraceae bacterium]